MEATSSAVSPHGAAVRTPGAPANAPLARGGRSNADPSSSLPSFLPLPPLTAQGMVRIPGGSFGMGTDEHLGACEEPEGPLHTVRLGAFLLDECAVTNAQFCAFVEATGYVTDAQRCGGSWTFRPSCEAGGALASESGAGWRYVEGACFRRPNGPHSSIADCMQHPVVHVSWNDACAYARWADKRLPTEAEWE